MSFHLTRLTFIFLGLNASAILLGLSWIAWNGISWKLARRARAKVRGRYVDLTAKREPTPEGRRLWRRGAA